MAVYCPEIKEPVLYITCLECESKSCKKINDDESKRKINQSPIPHKKTVLQ